MFYPTVRSGPQTVPDGDNPTHDTLIGSRFRVLKESTRMRDCMMYLRPAEPAVLESNATPSVDGPETGAPQAVEVLPNVLPSVPLDLPLDDWMDLLTNG